MSQVILKSQSDEPLLPLVNAALKAEMDGILLGMRRTEARIREFEEKHSMRTEDMGKKKSSEINGGEMELLEWDGEVETLKRLKRKLQALREINICT
jgi:hypothetical protein